MHNFSRDKIFATFLADLSVLLHVFKIFLIEFHSNKYKPYCQNVWYIFIFTLSRESFFYFCFVYWFAFHSFNTFLINAVVSCLNILQKRCDNTIQKFNFEGNLNVLCTRGIANATNRKLIFLRGIQLR